MLPSRAKVLDLGCGSGRASQHLLDKELSVTGIDFSQEMLKLAEKRVPGVNFQKMDMRKLTFPDGAFDGVWTSFSLIHIPRKEIKQVLGECRRVLKNNGVIFVSTSLGEEKEGLEDEWLKKGLKMFFYRMSQKGLQNHLQSAHFKIEEIAVKRDALENEDTPILYAFARK